MRDIGDGYKILKVVDKIDTELLLIKFYSTLVETNRRLIEKGWNKILFYTAGSEFLKSFSTGSYEGRQCKEGLGKLRGKQVFKHILKATVGCTL